MKFKKYNSITNAYNSKFITQIKNSVPENERWFITEKIDGANFAFYSDGKEVKVASRNQFVDGTFYNCQEVIDRYSEPAIAESAQLIADSDCDYVIFYGELYGPGIQKRVDYGPDKNFALFDVVLIWDDSERYLPQEFLSQIPGFATPPGFGGATLEEGMKHPNDHKSCVFLDASGPNQMEGVVLKPNITRFNNGGKRLIIKNKNASFSERVKKPKKTVELSGEQGEILTRLEEYITQTRYDNLFGKQPWELKDFGKFLGAYNQDIFTDAREDEPDIFDCLLKDERKQVTKIFNGKVAAFCRQFLASVE